MPSPPSDPRAPDAAPSAARADIGLDPALRRARRTAAARFAVGAAALDPVARRFAGAGHELALVGGWVRDAFLDRPTGDVDLATDAPPERTTELLRPVADAVWDVGAAFGTVGAQVGGQRIEVTTYRSDAYDRASRKPQVVWGRSLEEDLSRRDFTVNAMAVRLPGAEFVDPFDGLADLARGLLRTPASPQTSFSDDPLRILRAARFASQLGMSVAPDVVAAMAAMADRLEIVSAERIRDELQRLLLAPDPVSGLRFLVDTGVADHVLPELPALRLEIDEHHRHKDVYEHSLTVLAQAIALEGRLGGADLVVRLAALLHDIGKPKTRRFEPGGGVSFYHHDVVGAKLARKRLTALRFPREVVDAVARLVELHLRFHGYAGGGYAGGLGGGDVGGGEANGQWSDSAVRRYVRDAGDQLERLHVLTRADCTTRNRRRAAALRAAYDSLERRISELRAQEQLDALRPDLDGLQIMTELGIAPGPLVGRAYRHLLDLRIERGPMGEDAARAELRRWWAEQPESSG